MLFSKAGSPCGPSWRKLPRLKKYPHLAGIRCCQKVLRWVFLYLVCRCLRKFDKTKRTLFHSELFVTRTTGEDGHISYTFTDKLGQVVLERVMNGNAMNDTYYVYDANGNLKGLQQKDSEYCVQFAKFARRIAIYQWQHHQLRVRCRRREVKRNAPDGNSRRGNPHDQCNDSACSRTNIHDL